MKLSKKKVLVGALACSTLAASVGALAGCSGGSNWAVKTENASISSGVYRYCLFYAYQNATYSVKDYTKPITQQEIDGKPASDWMKEQALDYIKPYLVIEDKMKELDLKMTDAARYNAKELAAKDWKSYGSMLEGYGITQDDYQYTTYDYSAKYSQVFEAIYGEGGTKAVSEEKMHKYFLENYEDLDYLLVSTKKDDGTTMTDKEIKNLKKEFDKYADRFNKGDVTMEELAREYKDSTTEEKTEETSSAAEGEEQNDLSDIYKQVTGAITTQNTYPEKFVKAVEELKTGKAVALDLSDSGFMAVVTKNKIKDAEDEYFNKDDEEKYGQNVFSVLVDMKQAEFTKDMNKLIEKFDDKRLTFNDSEYNIDLQKLFEPDTLTSETASETTSSKKDEEKEDADKDKSDK